MIISRPAQLTINIDKDLRKELKKVALDEEKTVTEIVIALIQDYVNNHNK